MYLDEVYSTLHTWYPPYTSFFKQNCDTFSTEIKHFPDKRCFNFCSFPVTFQQGIIKNNVTGKKIKNHISTKCKKCFISACRWWTNGNPFPLQGEQDSFQAIRDYSTYCCEPNSVWIRVNPLVLQQDPRSATLTVPQEKHRVRYLSGKSPHTSQCGMSQWPTNHSHSF